MKKKEIIKLSKKLVYFTIPGHFLSMINVLNAAMVMQLSVMVMGNLPFISLSW